MSSTVLKIIACVAMLLDHTGYMMQTYGVGSYDTSSLLRIIGRMAFPIFAFLIAEGFKRTKNVVYYTLRLLLAGVISEIPFNLFSNKALEYKGSLNVMFTLAVGLVALIFADMCIKSSKKEVRFLFVLPLFAACHFAEIYGMDYKDWGVILIFLFYLVDTSSIQKRLMLLPVTALFASRKIISDVIYGKGFSAWDKTQLFALLAVIPLMLYSGKKGSGKKSKNYKRYLFYLFYPAHLLLLYLIFSNYQKIVSLF